MISERDFEGIRTFEALRSGSISSYAGQVRRVKALVLHFENEEFEALKAAKDDRTWREFFLDCLKKEPGSGRSAPTKLVPGSKEEASDEQNRA